MAVDSNDLTRIFSTVSHSDETRSTVILGAGIIGLSTAYYLCLDGNTKPDTIHLVEAADELFASASGRAAGFLASDWFGPATASLGALSFRLHKELADKHDGKEKWGYSRSTGTSLAAGNLPPDAPRGDDWLRTGGSQGSRAEVAGRHDFAGDAVGPAWLTRRRGDRVEIISEDATVAQVDPARLCRWLLQECVRMGVRLHQPARAVRVSRDAEGMMSGLRLRHGSGADLRLPCTRMLIAAGAWSGRVFAELFPESSIELPISRLAGHSIVVKSPRWSAKHEDQGCHAVFTTQESGFSPEVFSRIGGEIYVAGLNDPNLELPETATEAKVNPKCVEELIIVAKRMLGQDGTDVNDLEIMKEGLCFRPTTHKGTPLLAHIPNEDLGPGIETRAPPEGGVFVAAGHGPWGISQSLGTGKVMAEMLGGEKTSSDVRRLGL
ncbi:hypothetical protein LTR62_000664 [Meristemomyces frigidus]|uniref:FAD dependent oxidoreductase domain-containing protein n=1 Tax=Meristemomyces frigidus TaxID=1508187 RepID=A0AAN7T956_9PEZI|nr:hypothetical protein LTR62_000664 [Meristemomyces frigidus]